MKPKDIQYIKYIVNRYIKNKPELWDLREDLEQEGCMAWLKASSSYVEGSPMSRKLYIYYHVKQDIQDYLRDKEIPHFQKPPADINSPYWDLPDMPEVDEILDESEEQDIRYDLAEVMSGVKLTPRQSKVLELFLEGWTFEEIGKTLGIAAATAHEHYKSVIKRAREDNNI